MGMSGWGLWEKAKCLTGCSKAVRLDSPIFTPCRTGTFPGNSAVFLLHTDTPTLIFDSLEQGYLLLTHAIREWE